ncbi:MAG: ABC transporter ATP-binding protein [Phycisphaerales bacterium JB038]
MSCRDLTRDFDALRAVDHLSLEVGKGEIFGLLGPNGAGKTTTIRMLLGLVRPSSGSVRVLGHDPGSDGQVVGRVSGAVLEDGGLYERLTAADNLELWGRIWRLPRAVRRTRMADLLGMLGLYDRRNDAVAQWSRGMKQKLLLARALMHEPDLLLLDEPTSALDPEAAASLRETLRALAVDEGTTIFLTTHNLAEAEKLCSSVGILRDGRLVALGSPQSPLLGAYPRLEVTGGDFSDDVQRAVRGLDGVIAVSGDRERLTVEIDIGVDPSDVTRAVVQAGGAVRRLRDAGPSLEERYFELMAEDRT